jgi:hypothetical protein
MKKQKITKKELELIVSNQQAQQKLFSDIGVLEVQKHNLLHSISEVAKEGDEVKKELEQKYGSVNVNLETGEYTEIEKKSE